MLQGNGAASESCVPSAIHGPAVHAYGCSLYFFYFWINALISPASLSHSLLNICLLFSVGNISSAGPYTCTLAVGRLPTTLPVLSMYSGLSLSACCGLHVVFVSALLSCVLCLSAQAWTQAPQLVGGQWGARVKGC